MTPLSKTSGEAIAAVKKAFAMFRSELQDARAKVSTTGNRSLLDAWIADMAALVPDYEEIEEPLQSERNE